LRTGFRFDWKRSKDITFKVIGNAFIGRKQDANEYLVPTAIGTFANKKSVGKSEFYGTSFLVQMHRKVSNSEDYSFQLYLDKSGLNSFDKAETVLTADFDFQHKFSLNKINEIVWGLGYRRIKDGFSLENTVAADFKPRKETRNIKSAFIQDHITLKPKKLVLTLGSKFYDHPYVGTENHPSARLLWTPDNKHTVWSAISEAHRTPSRGETGVKVTLGINTKNNLPGTIFTWPFLLTENFTGAKKLESEHVKVKELGYRYKPSSKLSFDFAYYQQDYFNVLTMEQFGAPISSLPFIPMTTMNYNLQNNGRARYQGVELSSRYQIHKKLLLNFGYSTNWAKLYQTNQLRGASPEKLWFIKGNYNLSDNLEFDTYLSRSSAYAFVTPAATTNLDSHVRLDFRLGWKAKEGLEVIIGGQNLLSEWHREIGTSLSEITTEIPRNYYLKAEWSY